MMDGPSKEEKKPILADPEPQAWPFRWESLKTFLRGQVRAPHFQGDAMDKKV